RKPATMRPMPIVPPVEDAWLVIPVFNEQSVIGQVVAEARKTFPHVICVDDSSTDASGARAAEAGAVVVTHPYNLGQSAALQTGLSFALRHTDARYIVTFDADGQHRVVDALAMLDRAREEDLALVFGSRFLDDRTKPGFLKRL